MSLKRKSVDLQKRMQDALKGGGSVAIKKQKAGGKLTARERILSLLDKNSFHEYDLFVEHAGKDFDMNKKYYSGMWWTWLGFECAFCYEMIDIVKLLKK